MAEQQTDEREQGRHEGPGGRRERAPGEVRAQTHHQEAPESIARRYFEAIGARDLDTAVGLWAEGGRDNVRGQMDVLAPEGVRGFLGEIARRHPRPGLRGGLHDHRG